MRKMTVDYTLPKNIPLLFKNRAYEWGNLYSQASKDENGVFQKYTYSEVYEKIICFIVSSHKGGFYEKEVHQSGAQDAVSVLRGTAPGCDGCRSQRHAYHGGVPAPGARHCLGGSLRSLRGVGPDLDEKDYR